MTLLDLRNQPAASSDDCLLQRQAEATRPLVPLGDLRLSMSSGMASRRRLTSCIVSPQMRASTSGMAWSIAVPLLGGGLPQPLQRGQRRTTLDRCRCLPRAVHQVARAPRHNHAAALFSTTVSR